MLGSKLTVAENCCVALMGMIPLGGETGETLIAGTVMLAVVDAKGLATEVAVSVTVKSLAGVLGAVYVVGVPLGVEVGKTVPHDVTEHETVQVTPLFAESLVTVAVNCAVAPAASVAVFGATETVIPGIVTMAVADTEVLVTEVAVRVTVKLPAGAIGGAV